MKFQHLPLGARFEYEGKVYAKSGPLTATGEQGGQKVIPRFAVLKPLDAPPTKSTKAGRKLDEAAVLAAFDIFQGECLRLLHEAEPDTLKAGTRRARLDQARMRFLSDLGLAPEE